jgi:hypothetical protein
MRVALIGHQVDAAGGGQLEELFELVQIHDRAAGVARRVDDHHFGARGEMRLNGGGGEREALLLVGVGENAGAASVVDDVLIRHPVGDGDDDLVAGIDQRLREVEDEVLSAHGDDAFVGLVGGPEVLVVTVADGLPELGHAGRRGVLGKVLIDGAGGSALDVIGGGEIRLAGPEIDHVDALRAKPFGVRRHFHGGRDADGRNTF